MVTETLEQVTETRSTNLEEPEKFYFEVHGELKKGSADVAIGYLETEDIGTTASVLAGDYRFRFMSPNKIVIGTSKSTHYNLTKIIEVEFENPTGKPEKKPYSINSYMLLESQ